MNRTTAIIVTVVSALLCGCPGLLLVGTGVLAVLGSQMPEVMADNPSSPQNVLLGSGVFLCVGALLILIPILVGIFSLRSARPSEPGFDEPIPPAS